MCARGVKASRDREPPAAVCARGVLTSDRGVYCRCPHACGMGDGSGTLQRRWRSVNRLPEVLDKSIIQSQLMALSGRHAGKLITPAVQAEVAGWKEYLFLRNGELHPYYHHAERKVTTWEKPPEMAELQRQRAASAAAAAAAAAAPLLPAGAGHFKDPRVGAGSGREQPTGRVKWLAIPRHTGAAHVHFCMIASQGAFVPVAQGCSLACLPVSPSPDPFPFSPHCAQGEGESSRTVQTRSSKISSKKSRPTTREQRLATRRRRTLRSCCSH